MNIIFSEENNIENNTFSGKSHTLKLKFLIVCKLRNLRISKREYIIYIL